jgi:formiminotetrahydrofolate cyclodeaminase
MNLVSMPITDFCRELAGDAPAPGGGSVAALAGALAASLAAMVARLTVGRKKYETAWPRMESLRDNADRVAAELLALVDKDTEAYNRVAAAFGLPKGTDAEKEARNRSIQEATLEAARVPLQTLETAARCLELVQGVLEQGNSNCLTDAGVAVHLIRAAAYGAAYNVRVNLGSLKDTAVVAELAKRTKALLNHVQARTLRFEALVDERLG